MYVDGKTGNLLPPPSGVIFSPGLTSDGGVREEGAATFRLTDPTSPGQSPALPWLSVDAKTGLLKVKAQRKYRVPQRSPLLLAIRRLA